MNNIQSEAGSNFMRVTTATTAGALAVMDMAKTIAESAPTLADLNQAQLNEIAKMVMIERLKNEMHTDVDIAGIDWAADRKKFLSDCKSQHTATAYGYALDRLEMWTEREGLNPLTLTPAQADDFIRDLKADGRAAESVRRDVAAVSAFYTWMKRPHKNIENPIRGTKMRPERAAKKETVIPSADELKTILAEANPIEKALVSVMAFRGLRAGALPTIERRGDRFKGSSKGKTLKENEVDGVTFPAKVIEAIEEAGLDSKKPFYKMSANSIEKRIRYFCGKLYEEGKIKAVFSAHDFRHYFTVAEYTKSKDIFKLSKLLNHSGIQVTENYLRSLGIKARA